MITALSNPSQECFSSTGTPGGLKLKSIFIPNVWLTLWITVLACLPTTSFARDTFEDVIFALEEQCKISEGGLPLDYSKALFENDFDSDGQQDPLLDLDLVKCGNYGLPCGNAGCGVMLLVNSSIYHYASRNWRVVSFGDYPVLLLSVHGTQCGGSGVDRCVEAFSWNGYKLVSVSDNEE